MDAVSNGMDLELTGVMVFKRRNREGKENRKINDSKESAGFERTEAGEQT